MTSASQRVAWAITAIGALAAAAAPAQQSGSFERSLDVESPLVLDVTTGAGSITVTGGAAGRAEVSGRIEVRPGWRGGGDAAELISRFEGDPPVEYANGRLRVGDLAPEFRRNVVVSYEIRVPAATEVHAASGSGAQDVSGVTGPVEVTAGSGAIRLADVGEVEARTGSGRITAERVAGGFDARAGSGSIRLQQVAPGDVSVTTGSGNSELLGVDGAVRARAGSGGITVEGTPSGPWALETGSGGIRLRLPEQAAFDLVASTGSGRIQTDHPLTVTGSVERNRLNGRVRGGGERIEARTGSGGIRIE